MDEPISRYLVEIAQYPLIDTRQEITLAKRIKRGGEKGKQAAADLIHANLRLVVKIAKDYEHFSDTPLMDLISEGNIGLVEASTRYDPKRGAKFSTYAAFWIKQRVKRALSQQGATIRVPVHAADKVSRLRRYMARKGVGSEAITDEIGLELDISPSQLKRALAVYARVMVPLDANPSDEGEDTGYNFLPSESANSAELYEQDEVRKQLSEVLSGFTKREQAVIDGRFGLSGQEPVTLAVIAEVYGITRERIRQIEAKVLKAMRLRLKKLELAEGQKIIEHADYSRRS